MRVGYVIRTINGRLLARVGRACGEGTVNVAEYLSMIDALRHAFRLGIRVVEVCSDSQLMVRQLTGRYKVKDRRLRRLVREIKDLLPAFIRVSVKWVSRESNLYADQLSRHTVYEEVPLGPTGKSGGRFPRALHAWQAALVRDALARGATEYAMARTFSIPATSVRQIRLNKGYNDASLDNLPEWDSEMFPVEPAPAPAFPAPAVYTTFDEPLTTQRPDGATSDDIPAIQSVFEDVRGQLSDPPPAS
jgi:ribonuclease HI